MKLVCIARASNSFLELLNELTKIYKLCSKDKSPTDCIISMKLVLHTQHEWQDSNGDLDT